MSATPSTTPPATLATATPPPFRKLNWLPRDIAVGPPHPRPDQIAHR